MSSSIRGKPRYNLQQLPEPPAPRSPGTAIRSAARPELWTAAKKWCQPGAFSIRVPAPGKFTALSGSGRGSPTGSKTKPQHRSALCKRHASASYSRHDLDMTRTESSRGTPSSGVTRKPAVSTCPIKPRKIINGRTAGSTPRFGPGWQANPTTAFGSWPTLRDGSRKTNYAPIRTCRFRP
jgi:hypothetical protein